MRKLLTVMVAALLGLGWTGNAAAQDYPTHPITMIVPFPAGGATDTLARFLGRADAGDSRATHRHRERRGRRRQHRRRPRGARARRRLHAEHRHLDHAYADRRPLRAVLRPVEGSGAGHPDRQRAAFDRRQEGPAGGRSERADRLAQGQSRQGVGRHRRRRRHRPSRRDFVPEGDRHQIPVRAVSRQRAGDAGSAGRTDRFHDRAVVEFQIAGCGRQRQAVCRHRQDAAAVVARLFRPRTRPDCPASLPRCGTDCGCRRIRRRISSPSSTPPWCRCSPIPR